MSRIGNRPIKIEEGVEFEITASKVVVKKDQNQAELDIPSGISITKEDNNLYVKRNGESKNLRAMHGLITRLLSNAIVGVTEGFTRELEFKGTGYRVSSDENEMILNMGYSHEIKLPIPKGVSASVKKNSIILTGRDKEEIGRFAAVIREVRPPEVYKGKGIKYKEEFIKRKAGKKASS